MFGATSFMSQVVFSIHVTVHRTISREPLKLDLSSHYHRVLLESSQKSRFQPIIMKYLTLLVWPTSLIPHAIINSG